MGQYGVRDGNEFQWGIYVLLGQIQVSTQSYAVAAIVVTNDLLRVANIYLEFIWSKEVC